MNIDPAFGQSTIDVPIQIYQDQNIFRKFSKACGVFAIGLAGLVLIGGWLLNFEILRSGLPGLATMKVNTAIGIGGLGAAIWLVQENASKRSYRFGMVFASVAVLVGLVSLIEHGSQIDFGIDRVFFDSQSNPSMRQPPGRPSPATALALLLLGIAVLTVDSRPVLTWHAADFFAGIAGLLGYIDLLGYFYDVQLIYHISIYESMAFHTALIVCILSIGLIAARTNRGLAAILVSAGAGGYALRRLFPTVLIIPPLLGYLRITSFESKLLGFESGLLLHVVSFVVVLSCVVIWCARSMEYLDRARRVNLKRLQIVNNNLETQILERTHGLEEEVLRREASERTFSALLESAPDAMVVSNDQGRIVMTNLQTENMFGYRAEQLAGQPVELLIPERFRKGHILHRKQYMTAPQLRSMGVGLELFGLHRDGHEFPVAVSLSPVQLDQGLVVFSAIRDMREHRKIEREIRDLNLELKKQNRELEAVNRELQAFSYSVSHDLRAPLRAIDGFSQAVLEDYACRLDEEGQDFLRRVRAAAQHMGHLIDDLLRLSRVTQGSLSLESVNLSKRAEAIIQELREEEPDREVQIQIEPNLVIVGDRRLLDIVLANLLGNAWKFTAKKPEAAIEFERLSHEKPTTYLIRDNGAGFDMAYASKLFGAFQRMHDVREFPGTGIGLATVQRIIHRHGGRVWAAASEGHGATFYFSLPQ